VFTINTKHNASGGRHRGRASVAGRTADQRIDEFTADLISEGTLEGLAAARAQGRVGGRPTAITPTMVEVARRMHEQGYKPGEIARELRVGRATVYRHLAQTVTA
jgi:DNA invertase Pin-like site-specific DNA recombinase